MPSLRLLALVLLIVACACSTGHTTTPTRPPTTAPPSKVTPAPAAAGGVVAMGRAVRTKAGDVITVLRWRTGANRSIEPGPGQVYETIDVEYCPGPGFEASAGEVNALFSLELPDGGSVSPDNTSGAGDFRTKGTVRAGQCIGGPIVFQIQGGEKPSNVVYQSQPPTKWAVR